MDNHTIICFAAGVTVGVILMHMYMSGNMPLGAAALSKDDKCASTRDAEITIKITTKDGKPAKKAIDVKKISLMNATKNVHFKDLSIKKNASSSAFVVTGSTGNVAFEAPYQLAYTASDDVIAVVDIVKKKGTIVNNKCKLMPVTSFIYGQSFALDHTKKLVQLPHGASQIMAALGHGNESVVTNRVFGH